MCWEWLQDIRLQLEQVEKTTVRGIYGEAVNRLRDGMHSDDRVRQLFSDVQQKHHLPEAKVWADYFFQNAHTAAATKFSAIFDNYPADEWRLLEFARFLDPSVVPPAARPTTADFVRAVKFTKYLDINGRPQRIDQPRLSREWESFRAADTWQDHPEWYCKGHFDAVRMWFSPEMLVMYPTLTPLVLRILRIIPNSCDPERVFSAFKRLIVNHPQRSSLEASKKTGLVRCNYNQECCRDFDVGNRHDFQMLFPNSAATATARAANLN